MPAWSFTPDATSHTCPLAVRCHAGVRVSFVHLWPPQSLNTRPRAPQRTANPRLNGQKRPRAQELAFPTSMVLLVWRQEVITR